MLTVLPGISSQRTVTVRNINFDRQEIKVLNIKETSTDKTRSQNLLYVFSSSKTLTDY